MGPQYVRRQPQLRSHDDDEYQIHVGIFYWRSRWLSLSISGWRSLGTVTRATTSWGWQWPRWYPLRGDEDSQSGPGGKKIKISSKNNSSIRWWCTKSNINYFQFCCILDFLVSYNYCFWDCLWIPASFFRWSCPTWDHWPGKHTL